MKRGDLDILLHEGEGSTLEYEESLSSSFAQELVAFANSTGGKKAQMSCSSSSRDLWSIRSGTAFLGLFWTSIWSTTPISAVSWWNNRRGMKVCRLCRRFTRRLKKKVFRYE